MSKRFRHKDSDHPLKVSMVFINAQGSFSYAFYGVSKPNREFHHYQHMFSLNNKRPCPTEQSPRVGKKNYETCKNHFNLPRAVCKNLTDSSGALLPTFQVHVNTLSSRGVGISLRALVPRCSGTFLVHRIPSHFGMRNEILVQFSRARRRDFRKTKVCRFCVPSRASAGGRIPTTTLGIERRQVKNNRRRGSSCATV